MATKPNETYKWGENATHEQVAAYEDTGWPSDIIPPKRTQFNWYQNLVGKWLGWAEDAVDEIVDLVVDAWFVEVANAQGVPHKTGIYKRWSDHRFYLVHGDQMATVGFDQSHFTAGYYTWDGSQWVESSNTFNRSNSRTAILQESETNYVTPNGLVDYFSVPDSTFSTISAVPHRAGVYTVAFGISLVAGDILIFMPDASADNNEVYKWVAGAWVYQS